MSRNLSLLTDYYQLTMMQGYLLRNVKKTAVFDLFYRRNPFNNGYAVFAGLNQAIEFICSLKFTAEDLEYLSNFFKPQFINYLENFKFTGDVCSVPEGTVVFPNEPLVTVKAPIIEAQFIESALLNFINHQTLIATKAARIKLAAQNDTVFEFGLRRAQSPDAAIYGTRASFIGGVDATSNVLAAKRFDIPAQGTLAHSWIMSFDDELSAFHAFAKIYPDNCILLVDTYNTLKSGLPNAIKVFKTLNSPKVYGVRLDSGDLAYLTKIIRQKLDAEGFHDAVIVASNDLDENIITSLKQQDAKINSWGIGTKLITGCGETLGGVYKLVALENDNGELQPKIKISDNVEKISTPGFKQIVRLYTKNKIKADLITLCDESLDASKNLTLFSPEAPWKQITLEAGDYSMRKLQIPVMIGGELVYSFPNVSCIKQYCMTELESLWPEYKRFINPHIMPVDLSNRLYKLKNDMINTIR